MAHRRAGLLTYSRPAVALLQDRRPAEAHLSPVLITAVDALHAVLLLLLTTTALVALFLWRERRWLEDA